MERIEPVRRPAAPVRRRPKLTPVSVCQAIHDALTVLRALCAAASVPWVTGWPDVDAVVTDQKQMYHDFLRSRFVTRWRAFFRSPTPDGLHGGTAEQLAGAPDGHGRADRRHLRRRVAGPLRPHAGRHLHSGGQPGPHVVSQDTEELDTGYLSPAPQSWRQPRHAIPAARRAEHQRHPQWSNHHRRLPRPSACLLFWTAAASSWAVTRWWS